MAPGWKGKRGPQHCLSQEEQIRHYARSHLDQEHPSLRSHLSYPQWLPRPRGSPSIRAPALCFLAVSHCKQHPCLPHLHITELSWRVTDVTEQSPSRLVGDSHSFTVACDLPFALWPLTPSSSLWLAPLHLRVFEICFYDPSECFLFFSGLLIKPAQSSDSPMPYPTATDG